MSNESEGNTNPGANCNMEELRSKQGISKRPNTSRVWKNGERFQGIDSVSGEYISGKIMYRAGKATGANREFEPFKSFSIFPDPAFICPFGNALFTS